MVTGRNFFGSPTPGLAPEIDGAEGNTGNTPKEQDSPIATSASAPANPQEGKKTLSSSQSIARAPESDQDELIGYDKQIEALEAAAASINVETPEQKKKRERLERSKKIIGAFTDGLSALSNLFFTTQYSPNSYNPQHSHLGKVNERIEAMKAERKADAERYHNLMLRLGDVQNAKGKTLRDIKAQHEAQRLAREAAQREAELHPWAVRAKQSQADKEGALAMKAGYDAESSRMESENKPSELDLKNRYIKAGIEQRQASAVASRASAANSYASASAHNRSNQNEFSAWDKHGNEHKFKTEDAAIAYAKQHGTYQETEEEETSTTTGKSAGRETDTTTTKTKKSGYAARPQKKSPTAGGGAGKKSPTS